MRIAEQPSFPPASSRRTQPVSTDRALQGWEKRPDVEKSSRSAEDRRSTGFPSCCQPHSPPCDFQVKDTAKSQIRRLPNRSLEEALDRCLHCLPCLFCLASALTRSSGTAGRDIPQPPPQRRAEAARAGQQHWQSWHFNGGKGEGK